MYYPELSEIIKKTGVKEAIEKLDTYLAFLPNRSEKIITTSNVATMLELDFSIVEVILEYIYNIGLFSRTYICRCPNCGREIFTSDKKDLLEKAKEYSFCRKCKQEVEIGMEDIYVGYKLIKQPELDEDKIKAETEKVLKFNKTDDKEEDLQTLKYMFEKNKENPHDFFYNPSKADIDELKMMFESLDFDYGDSTTAQGGALEGLMCKLFNICIGMKATTVIRTSTNQIDCTVRNDYLIPLTVYNELGSIVKVECKNEHSKKAGNTYYHKLYGILQLSKSKSEQAVGILVSRDEIAKTCKDLARQYFLRDNIIIINISDKDLKNIVNKKVNFLDLLQEKIQMIKNNISTLPEKHKLYRTV